LPFFPLPPPPLQLAGARAIELVAAYERQGSLTAEQAEEFVREALETFRWHGEATVTAETYNRLNDAHRLIADVVSFRGPHINHLTPRTLDIDAAQAGMPKRGITPKAVIEGPPRRNCAILLRQTSFKALEETVAFKSATGGTVAGAHTARFGEIEQRGAALTPKGRKIYDDLLSSVRGEVQVGSSGAKKCAIDVASQGVISRGILLDIPKIKKVDWLENGTPISTVSAPESSSPRRSSRD